MNCLYIPNPDVSFLKRSFLSLDFFFGLVSFFSRSRSKEKKKQTRNNRRGKHTRQKETLKNSLSFLHLGAGNHRERCGVSTLPPTFHGARLLQQGPPCCITDSRVRLLRKPSSFLEWSLARDISLLLLTYSTHNSVASCSRHYII